MIPIPRYFDKVIKPAMEGYYSDDDYNSDLEINNVCKCPLHDENTPSFRWYPETNTYYCWGCSSGGDIVKLHREFITRQNNVNVSFNEALNFLDKLRVNDEVGQLGVKLTHVYDVDSTNTEILILSKAVCKYENLIKELDMDRRIKMYSIIDSYVTMVNLKKINALEAKKKIDSKYEEIRR